MIKSIVLLAVLITPLLLTTRPAHSDQETITQEAIPSVRIPEGTSLNTDPPHCPSNVFAFSGYIELDGKLDVYWYEHVIDAASPTDLLTETRLALDFSPTIESQQKLPVVLFADEKNDSKIKIRLGNLGHRQAESLLLMFGFSQTKKMMKQKKNQSFEGTLTLSTYSTYMECNARHYDGEVVAFKQSTKPVKMTSIAQRQTCGD